MSNKDLLDNIKKLRELTGVGFKDCKSALDETKGDIEKSIEFLRKKGIAKASKKMSRTASEGLALVKIKINEKKKWGYIDYTGNLKIFPEYLILFLNSIHETTTKTKHSPYHLHLSFDGCGVG